MIRRWFNCWYINRDKSVVYIDKPIQDTAQDSLKTVKATGYKNYYTIDSSLLTSNQCNIRETSIQNISLKQNSIFNF